MIQLVMSERKAIDEKFTIARKRGNGLLRREVWVDEHGQVVRYNLAYINHAIYSGDNGRVIGYDNERGKGDHRHVDGVESRYKFESAERLVEDFLARV